MISVAVVGAGIVGRMVAFALSQSGAKVFLFEQREEHDFSSCSYAASSMLAPVSELGECPLRLARLGAHSVKLWADLMQREQFRDVYFRQRGTLILAHARDQQELSHFDRLLEAKRDDSFLFFEKQRLTRAGIADLEPDLADGYGQGIFIANEAQVDNRQMLDKLMVELKRDGVEIKYASAVDTLRPGSLKLNGETKQFDLLIDCRGMGAREDLHKLRGVRGEIVTLHAPGASLSRPVRILHPRYPLYVVPRPGQNYLVGATVIESSDCAPPTVQSTLELLSAVFCVLPSFAEAHVVELVANVRPAFPSNEPAILVRPGLIRVNGLYRHGFLLAPAIAEAVSLIVRGELEQSAYEQYFVEMENDKVCA